jgi:hypothetical protein
MICTKSIDLNSCSLFCICDVETIVHIWHMIEIFYFFSGEMTLLNHPYPRNIEEPNLYETIRIHVQLTTADDNVKEPELSVCISIVIPPLPGGGGGTLFYLCPSVRPSFRPSKICLYPRSPKREGGILFYVCPSVCPSFLPSVRPSVRPSVLPSIQDIFVAFFSVTVDGRNLIFGHKRHIGIPYCG